ncbi:hypothetical protein SAMN04489747_0580 [Auraticoccus monumenti]|uniref:Uncharacterized protein n=1 Tax=Auraticoccus monumenti TaxID=675864 RepID=A0A1G6TBR7_9ACTN|nr:hypothetical protein SAMN04489747_0580 [Auraticoccus monumenti]
MADVEAAARDLGGVDQAAALAALSSARERIDALIDEVAAQGVLAGQSVRSLAEAAGVAPNTLSPRLARTTVLGGYAEDGRVGAEGIARARYDLRNGQYRPAEQTEPLTFRARRSRKDRS